MNAPTVPRDPALAAYVAAARSAPFLTAEQELQLARRYRDNGDQGAADKLVTAHLRLVVKIANRYRGYEMPMADLIGEGTVGLMQAVQRFEPDQISRERIRQIEMAAFDKLKAAVERQTAERRRAMMARHSWAMPAVVLGKPDPERDAREIAESEVARPRRGRRVAVAA